MFLFGFLLGVLIVAFVVWLWLIAPGKGADFTEFHKYDYAHRGLHDNENGVPENSELGARLAVENGFGIELDLQLTKDKQVVVHHDHSLKRSCGEDVLVSDLTLKELKERHLFGTDERVPLFTDFLKIVDGKTPLIIEFKGYGDPEELCPLAMEILKNYKGLYCIESFDPRIVAWFKKHHPEIVRGQLMHRMKPNDKLNGFQAWCATHMLTNYLTRPHFEAYDFHKRSIPSLAMARGLFGMQEVSWTIRKPEEYAPVKKLHNLCIFEGFVPAETEGEAKEKFTAVMQRT